MFVVYEYNECEVVVCIVVCFVQGECIVYVFDVGMLGVLDFGLCIVEVVCVVGQCVILLLGVSVVVMVLFVVGELFDMFGG